MKAWPLLTCCLWVQVVAAQDLPNGKLDSLKSVLSSTDVPAVDLAITNYLLADLFREQEERDSAETYFTYSLNVARQSNSDSLIAENLLAIGSLMRARSSYDSALRLLTEAASIGKAISNNRVIGWANKESASVHLTRGNLEMALNHGTTGYEIGVKAGILELAKESADILQQAFSRKRDFQRAYLYLKLFKQHSDSLLDVEEIRRSTAMEYEFAQEQANRIQALELQAQEALYLSQINEQKKARNTVIAGLVLVVIVLAVLWISYWQKRKINAALEEKNKIISEQAQNLSQLNETKDRFFSIISHDLRGPMGVFQGFSFMVKTMLEEKKYEKLENFADQVGKISKQMSELLDNLLNWAMRQQGQVPYHPEVLSLKECIDEIFDIFVTMASSKKIELTSEVLPASQVFADKNSLMAIMRNLVNNALKFTPQEGKIRVHCGKEEGYVAVKISDTGIGIDPDKIATLFHFDEKKASKGTEGERGVGLGLQLVHDFVTLNKGKITVDSEHHKGTTFTVLLPPPPEA